jgi:hypothetical protein
VRREQPWWNEDDNSDREIIRHWLIEYGSEKLQITETQLLQLKGEPHV